jgi:hypothetical protein
MAHLMPSVFSISLNINRAESEADEMKAIEASG